MKLLTVVTLLVAFAVACSPAATNTPAPAPEPQIKSAERLSHRQRMAIFIVRLELERRGGAVVAPTCVPPPSNQDDPANTARERHQRERYQWECERKARQAEYQRFLMSDLSEKNDGWVAVFRHSVGLWRVTHYPQVNYWPEPPANRFYVCESTGVVEGPFQGRWTDTGGHLFPPDNPSISCQP